MNRFSDLLASKLPFFYGYAILVIAVLMQVGSSAGQTFAIAAFTPFLQKSLGLSSSTFAAAFMLGTILAALPLAMVGPLSDRFGIRWTSVGAALALSLACVITSRATGFFSLLLSFFLLRFLGQGALSLLGSNMVSMWFQQRLGSVNSAISVGGAAAFALVPLVLLECIQRIGWQQTYVAMGAFVLVTLVPLLVLVLRNRPEDLGQRPDGFRGATELNTANSADQRHEPELTLSEAASHPTFWILAIGLALWAMIGTGIIFYALQIFQQYGIPPDRSKLLFVTFSSSMLILQIVGGILADRLPMHRLMAVGFALIALGTMVIPFTSREAHVHLFALLFGAGQGLLMSVNSTMWVRYYGRKHLGKIRGTVWCMTVAGSGCGPYVLGLFQEAFGSFSPGLWMFAAMLSALAPLWLWATAPVAIGRSPEQPLHVVRVVTAAPEIEALSRCESQRMCN